MTEEDIARDAELDRLVEQVRESYGMASREDAMRFLLKRRLRRGAQLISGRGRALHLIRDRGE